MQAIEQCPWNVQAMSLELNLLNELVPTYYVKAGFKCLHSFS